MNIHAKENSKVIYTGATDDQVRGHYGGGDDPRGVLETYGTYTVDHTVVDDWYTDVILKEFPLFRFNSVLFEDKE